MNFQGFLNLKPEKEEVIKSIRSVSKDKHFSNSKDEMTITTSREQLQHPVKLDFDLTQKILETDSEDTETVKDVELTYSKNNSSQKK